LNSWQYGGGTAPEILDFARAFDPQPLHLDEDASRSATGGPIASGWHACACNGRGGCVPATGARAAAYARGLALNFSGFVMAAREIQESRLPSPLC
jgi:acyl dehydratase